MIILPAIDLMGGKAVRLRQGRKNEKTDYFADPTEPAVKFAEAGASWLHVVDLDGAFSGGSQNLAQVKRIVDAVDGRMNIELGGGIRTLEHIEGILELGVARAILGTAILTNPDLLPGAVKRFGAERVVAGLDARDGLVAIRGWEDVSEKQALDVAKEVSDSGAERIIFTDIATDGMMTGPNIKSLREMAQISGLKVIASGGVSRPEDVQEVLELESDGVEGMIIGRALYEGTIELKEALAMVSNKER